jgi:predicted enzyme related to lactoylglutathione lyase
MTTDPEAAKRFYGELFGWKWEEFHMPGMTYTVVKVAGEEMGGIMQIPAEAGGAPPSWGTYVTVDDVDATVKKAESMQAKGIVPPRDIPDVGRFAVIQDPQGAVLMVINLQVHGRLTRVGFGAVDGRAVRFAVTLSFARASSLSLQAVCKVFKKFLAEFACRDILPDDHKCLERLHGIPIGPVIVGERFVAVDEPNDPGRLGNISPPVRIAASIQFFMMLHGGQFDIRASEPAVAQDVVSLDSVLLDFLEFLIRELPRRFQQLHVDFRFAHIVQQRAKPEYPLPGQ